MINGRRIISAVICGLIFAVTAHANMVPVSHQDFGCRQPHPVCDRINHHDNNLYDSYNSPSVANLSLWPVGFLPQANTDIEQTSEIQQLQSLTDGPSSIGLCLSALIGLGLCSSTHLVKKLSFSFIPEWYHNGGPFQIGHSHPITPESLCTIRICCFVQPVCTVEDSLPIYRLVTITSHWRKSQFTPTVLVPRGPPTPNVL